MFKVVADAREKALISLIQAAKEQGIDVFALAERAERDVLRTYDGGHALTIINEIKTAQGLVEGWFSKDVPVKTSCVG